jgi:succinate dehydrogenase flavin-adding protein (antitoxin of CptAB toxin-antitoxin module)
MKKYILLVLIWFNVSSCSIFTEEVIEPKIELTAEEIEQIEREKFDSIIAEEDRKIIEIIQQKKQLEVEKQNKIY